MKKTIIIILATMAVLSSSCDFFYLDCIEGNGILRTEERNAIAFDELTVGGPFDVYISRSDHYSIQIEAEENLLPYISTRTRNGHLLIETVDHRCLKKTLPITIHLSTPDLSQVILSGSGTITSDTLYTDYLDVILSGSGIIDLDAVSHNVEALLSGAGQMKLGLETEDLEATISGSGNINLNGSTYASELLISGSGQFLGYGMEQERCIVTISASGRAMVSVNDLLDVYISGSGSVYYRGHPTVRTYISGSGTVVNDN